MAEFGQRPIVETFVASLNLPTANWEHKFVDVTSAGTITAPTAGGAAGAGVLEIGGNAGDGCTVTVIGVTKVRGGTALPGGTRITSAASGYAVAVTSGTTPLGKTIGNCASGYLATAVINGGGGTIG